MTDWKLSVGNQSTLKESFNNVSSIYRYSNTSSRKNSTIYSSTNNVSWLLIILSLTKYYDKIKDRQILWGLINPLFCLKEESFNVNIFNNWIRTLNIFFIPGDQEWQIKQLKRTSTLIENRTIKIKNVNSI